MVLDYVEHTLHDLRGEIMGVNPDIDEPLISWVVVTPLLDNCFL
jgi:hypothetical protein